LKVFPKLRLSVGHGCHRLLVWDCVVPDRGEVPELVPRLAAKGYRDATRFELVRELYHPDHHSVVIVPRTGRVEIRVHYLTPLDRRAGEAHRVARDVAGCLALGIEEARASAPPREACSVDSR